MSKPLDEATLEELQQELDSRRYNEHAGRIKEILSLQEELDITHSRCKSLNLTLEGLRFHVIDCPNKLLHRMSGTDICPLCHSNYYI